MSDTAYPLLHALKVELRDHIIDKFDNPPAAYVDMLTYTNLVTGDSAILKPGIVKVGRFQDDPTDVADTNGRVDATVAIFSGDPNKDTWRSGMFQGGTNENDLGISAPIREIGGAYHWWERLYIEWQCYMIGAQLAQLEADRIAAVFKTLLEAYCASKSDTNPHGWDVAGLRDPLGQMALAALLSESFHVGRGGASDWIQEGELWVQVLTLKP